MSLPLRVLGDRVLVKPDVDRQVPVVAASGVVLAASLAAAVLGEDPVVSVHRGIVVGVGRPRHPLHDVAESLADKLAARSASDDDLAHDAARLIRDVVRRAPCVTVGMEVLFSPDAGLEVGIDDETYVILHEHELLAVVVGAEAWRH